MTEEQTTQNMLMELIKEECTIKATEVLEYPPSVLSLGQKTLQTKGGEITYPISIATSGNLSYILHHLKQKKFFCITTSISIFKWW